MSDHDPRVVKHVDALANASTDLDAFVAALEAIKNDRNLTTAGKTVILKVLAQEQAIHWLAACSGQKPKPPPTPSGS